MCALFVCVGVGGGVQGRCGGGGESQERKEGEGSGAEHNNCSCVHNRGSSNMRALGHRKGLRGISQFKC